MKTLSERYRDPSYEGPLCGNVIGTNGRIERDEGVHVIYTGSNQRVPEFHAWASLVRGLGARSYVELGVGSAWSIRDAGIANIVTVDLLPNGLPGLDHVQGSSQDPATQVHAVTRLGTNPDVVFIDADHSYEGCKRDFELWHPIAQMAVGFHDIRLAEGSDRLWEEVSQQYPSIEIIGRDLASAQQWQHTDGEAGRLRAGGIGVIFKL
jgi:hypothetical protein